MPEQASFTLAVCAEMVFRELPITERIRKIDALGFQVEIWDWTRHDIDFFCLKLGAHCDTSNVVQAFVPATAASFCLAARQAARRLPCSYRSATREAAYEFSTSDSFTSIRQC